MGPTGGGHDAQTAHGGTDHRSAQGRPSGELCRKHGISDATFYKWRAKYAGLEVNDVKKLRQLEDETGG
jgi:transposase